MAESLHCLPETITTLLIDYTPRQNKTLKKNKQLSIRVYMGFHGDSVVKNQPAMQERWVRFPGSESSPGEGNSNPPQYSCLGNPMNREAGRLQSMGSQKKQT